MGGRETTRLLLVSNDLHRGGIGNEHDLLGRFYLSQMTGDIGEVTFTPHGGPVIWNYERTPEGVYCQRALAILERKQRAEGLLNFRAMLSHASAECPQPSRHGALEHLAARCGNLMREFLRPRRPPSLAFAGESNTYTLQYSGEQSPNRESRVTLSARKDSFGINFLRADWRAKDLDVKSVIRSFELIGDSLEASGVGKLRFEPRERFSAIRENGAGSHHLGTTRMAFSPMWGVADENCRIFGVDNLYVASRSLFPTSGCADPTLTTVALAIRLADHLKQVHARGAAQFVMPVLAGKS